MYCSSSAQEAIHHTTHWSRVLHHNGGLNQYKSCVSCVVLFGSLDPNDSARSRQAEGQISACTPVFEPQGSAGTRNPTFGAPGRGAPEFAFRRLVLLRPPHPCVTPVRLAPSAEPPSLPTSPRQLPSAGALVIPCQRRQRPGGERTASVVPASIHEAGRPHCHTLAHPRWFFVTRASCGHGGPSCVHHGKRAPVLPPLRRRLRRMARLSRRTHPRRWGLRRAIFLAAPRPTMRGQ